MGNWKRGFKDPNLPGILENFQVVSIITWPSDLKKQFWNQTDFSLKASSVIINQYEPGKSFSNSLNL